MAESVTGCVTLSSCNARATGMWIMLNRRRRVFLPSSVGTVAVGDVITVTGWQEEDHESAFVMAQSCAPSSLFIPGDVSGLSRALYGRQGRPDHGELVIELLGPVLRWLLASGWGALAREIAKGSLRTVRTMYQDVFVLNRRRGLPYQVTRYLHTLLGRQEEALGHLQTGPTGSGKSQMVLRVAEWCRAQGLGVACTALTGKAASLLGPEGQTLHRLLGYGGGGYSVEVVTQDVVFVDEMSMLVWPILSRLLSVCRGQIVFSGDPRQLPPVGSVSVMTELLGCLPALVLPTFLREDGPERVLSCVQKGMEWQVLAPVHDGELGVRRLNHLLQAAVSPEGVPVGAGFRVGDRVMVTKNCYTVTPPIYNGMVGRVVAADGAGLVMRLELGRVVSLDPAIVELAYCLTIYRAQGSRYDWVFVVMPTGIRAGYLEDPRVQEVARTRGREQTYLLVC